MKQYLVSLDQGTTSSRAIIFAVSYTHLDVYKRQAPERLRIVLEPLHFLQLVQMGDPSGADSFRNEPGPVSYTHLVFLTPIVGLHIKARS